MGASKWEGYSTCGFLCRPMRRREPTRSANLSCALFSGLFSIPTTITRTFTSTCWRIHGRRLRPKCLRRLSGVSETTGDEPCRALEARVVDRELFWLGAHFEQIDAPESDDEPLRIEPRPPANSREGAFVVDTTRPSLRALTISRDDVRRMEATPEQLTWIVEVAQRRAVGKPVRRE